MSCCKRLGRKPPQVHAMLSPRAQDRTGRCVISPSRIMLSPPHYGLRRHTIHSLLGTQTRHTTSLQQPFNLIHCHPQRRERGERERVREPFLNFYTNASLPKPKPSSFTALSHESHESHHHMIHILRPLCPVPDPIPVPVPVPVPSPSPLSQDHPSTGPSNDLYDALISPAR